MTRSEDEEVTVLGCGCTFLMIIVFLVLGFLVVSAVLKAIFWMWS